MNSPLFEKIRVVKEHPKAAGALALGAVTLVGGTALYAEGLKAGLEEGIVATSAASIPAELCDAQGATYRWLTCTLENIGYNNGLRIDGRQPGPNELPGAFQRIVSLTNIAPVSLK